MLLRTFDEMRERQKGGGAGEMEPVQAAGAEQRMDGRMVGWTKREKRRLMTLNRPEGVQRRA